MKWLNKKKRWLSRRRGDSIKEKRWLSENLDIPVHVYKGALSPWHSGTPPLNIR
jgi:hypothetical protein